MSNNVILTHCNKIWKFLHPISSRHKYVMKKKIGSVGIIVFIKKKATSPLISSEIRNMFANNIYIMSCYTKRWNTGCHSSDLLKAQSEASENKTRIFTRVSTSCLINATRKFIISQVSYHSNDFEDHIINISTSGWDDGNAYESTTL